MGYGRWGRLAARRLGFEVMRRKEFEQLKGRERYEPGHYYSVIPSLDDVRARAATIFRKDRSPAAIDLDIEGQIEVLREFRKLHDESPYRPDAPGCRFDVENDQFSWDDGPVLHYMLRKLRPRRVIEIGSGNSSAVMLDTDDSHLGGVEFTFIDPNCQRVRSMLSGKDLERVRLIEQRVELVEPETFAALESGDLLFVDSSHVMKVGSDLHRILFDIVPALPAGVCVHFHDLRYPFEYPQEWIMGGRFWNEAYLLRAFLMWNSGFELTFWLSSLLNQGREDVRRLCDFLPLSEWDRRFGDGSGDYSDAGGSLYLTRRG